MRDISVIYSSAAFNMNLISIC